MSVFEIIMVAFGFLSLVGGIAVSYTKNMIEIAKIQVQIRNLEKDMTAKELAILKLEERNTLEHDRILIRINELIERDYVKK